MTLTPTTPAAPRRSRSKTNAASTLTTASVPTAGRSPSNNTAAPQLPDLSAYQPTTAANPLGWDLRAVRVTCYGPDQRGVLRQYAADPRANTNPPLLGLAGLLLGVDIIPAAADRPHGGRLYLAIDLQGQLPEQINQLRLRIGTGEADRNWPIRTALHGLIAGDFTAGSEVGLCTRAGTAIFFCDVLHASGRAVIPPRGYWGSSEAIGHTPLDILLAVNTLRRRLGQQDLGPEVFGDLLNPAVDITTNNDNTSGVDTSEIASNG